MSRSEEMWALTSTSYCVHQGSQFTEAHRIIPLIQKISRPNCGKVIFSTTTKQEYQYIFRSGDISRQLRGECWKQWWKQALTVNLWGNILKKHTNPCYFLVRAKKFIHPLHSSFLSTQRNFIPMWPRILRIIGSKLHKQGRPSFNDQSLNKASLFYQLVKEEKNSLAWVSGGVVSGWKHRVCDKFLAEICWCFRLCCGEHLWTFPHSPPAQVGSWIDHWRLCEVLVVSWELQVCSGVCSVNN